MTEDEGQRIVKEAADKLGEMFDSVVILASWYEEDVTQMARSWSGNYYAARGMVDAFDEAIPDGEAEAE